MAFSNSPIRPIGDTSFLFLAGDANGKVVKQEVAEVNNESLAALQANGQTSPPSEANRLSISKISAEDATQRLVSAALAKGTGIRNFA